MSDSFFTSRNIADDALTQANRQMCTDFIDASVRRMVRLDGALETAKRVQRIADICAGAYVLPIEHWRADLPKADPAAPPPVSLWRRTIDLLMLGDPVVTFWLGFMSGVLLCAASLR